MRKEPVYIDIGEYNFCIRPFSALDGGYAALFVTKKLLPMLKVMASGSDDSSDDSSDKKNADALLDLEVSQSGLEWDKVLAAVMPILDGIDRKELGEFMELCLNQVDIRMKAGYMPLYRHGVFADEDIGCSTVTCLRLCFETVKPLVADFFDENGLNLSRQFKQIMSQSQQ